MTWKATEPVYTKLEPGNGVIPVAAWEHLNGDSQPDGCKAYCYISEFEAGELAYRLRITKPVEGGDGIMGDCHLPWAILQTLKSLPPV